MQPMSIHAWWVPSFGIKKDAVPGFINELWFNAKKAESIAGNAPNSAGGIMVHAYRRRSEVQGRLSSLVEGTATGRSPSGGRRACLAAVSP